MDELLRPYQLAASLGIRKILANCKSAILCMPTGAGKTITAAHIVWRSSLKGLTAVFLTDREVLVNETFNKFQKVEQFYFQYIGKDFFPHKGCNTFLAMVETFYRRQSQGKFNKIVDLFIFDEGHMGNYKKIKDMNPHAMCIALTATPVGSGKTPLKDIYDDIYVGESVPELIKMGFLVPAIDFTSHHILQMKMERGDFTCQSQIEAFKRSGTNNKLLEFLKKSDHGRKSICFNIDIAHSESTTEFLRKNGYNAVHVDSKFSDLDKARIFRDYHDGKIEILCNVGMATKGFDDPATDQVILNRSTASITQYYQMIGRGSRIHPGKENFYLLDLGNNIFRHGSYNDEMDWKHLFLNEKQDVQENIKDSYICSHCECYVRNFHLTLCPTCGSAFPRHLVKIEGGFKPPEYIKTMDINHMDITELNMYGKWKGYKPGFAYMQWQRNRINPVYWKFKNAKEKQQEESLI